MLALFCGYIIFCVKKHIFKCQTYRKNDIIQENEQKLNIFCTSLNYFLYLCARIISFYHH